jgi:signal transduction histidine kinase/CheY-like chemotaxis protein
MRKQNLSRYFVIVFYAAAMLAAVLYAYNKQNNDKRGGNSPIYRNLRECPTYARKGFDPADLRRIPDEEQDGVWKRFETSSRRIVDSGLDIPKRSYLSPWGNDDEEFTIVFLLEMDSTDMAYINGIISVIPGIYFAGIGESWEVYFNGKLILSEMYLSETGRIRERRTWNEVSFPVDGSFVLSGTNILALRILGDPTYRGTGLYYSSAPIYMDNYRNIESRRFDYLYIFLCGLFAFTGLYFLMLFFSIKKKAEIFYLYFGIFSILICVYIVSLQGLINSLISNSDISRRLEFGSLILAIPIFGMFLEALGRGKTTKISRSYMACSFFLCLTQTFFCLQYGEEIIIIWNVITMIYTSYLLVYEVIYFHFWKRQKENFWEAIPAKSQTLPIGNILVGMCLCYFCGAFDILHNMFFKDNSSLFSYSVFVVYIGMVFTLSRRFSGMYKQLEQSNVILETTVKERTLELEEQTVIAVQASRAKSEFLATMSHEIRTPLNAVIGLSEIELRNRLSDSSRENIIQIHQSGASLLGIINDILDISKIEAGSFELVPVEYETAPFISGTVNLNMVRLGSKPISLVLKINGDFPAKLIGDELRVKQVLNNLLSNAIKYTDEGTVTLNMAWSARSAGMVRLVFTVRDTGIGIRAEDMGKLFTSYTQLNTGANRKIEGTGLGLAITKNLVEMMGGSISVESEYGKGSVFTAEIIQGIENTGVDDTTVIGEETAEALRNFRYTSEKKDKAITTLLMPHVQILVVDDLPSNLLVVRGLLAPYGLQVDTAASGQEAVEKARSRDYDLIFMDHMMPEMDGVETTAAIRKLEMRNEESGKSVKQTPIIALTANALRGMKEFYLENGFQDYLSKPVSPEALDEIINKWLNNPDSPVPRAVMPPPSPFSLEIEAQRLDILNHFIVSFTSVPETDWQAKFDTAYFERFTTLIKSTVTGEMPAALREQADFLAETGRKEDTRKIREALPAFCDALQKWQEQKAAGNGQGTEDKTLDELLPRLEKALLAGETETAEAVIGELGKAVFTPAGRELYFRLYALMFEGNTEKIMEAIKGIQHD